MSYVKWFMIGVLCFSADIASAGGPVITSAPEKVSRYAPFRLSFELPYFKTDPYDPDKVNAALLIKTPSGKDLEVPAFCISNKKKTLRSQWEARFTPQEEGKYEFRLRIGSGPSGEQGSPRHFYSGKSGLDGFLRKSPDNPYYLVFDSGKPFFGIGHSVAWVSGSSSEVFDRYFSEFQANGCNMTRVWMCDWSFPLDWKTLGSYDGAEASKLDKLMDLAAERGVYIILSLDTYGSLMPEEGPWGENKWAQNPYNRAKGGPCETPKDFFTNAEAKRLYKNKLRYIVSRWGYSPNILAFELWNEYNAPPEWVKEMAGYIKSLNPHGQFVTTSHGYPYGTPFDEASIWALDEMDIVTMHVYGNGSDFDLVPALAQKSAEAADRYKKPFIVAEFGIDYAKDDKENDPEGKGIELHNSIWASTMLRSFGVPLNWWWDTYVRPKGLYGHYKALASFLKGVDWGSMAVSRARTTPVTFKASSRHDLPAKDVVIKTEDKFGKLFSNEWVILRNGDIDCRTMPNKYLHGMVKKDIRVDHKYVVDYPEDGKFILLVGLVSQGGELHISVDGKEIYSQAFPAGAGTGPWKRSLYMKQWNIYQCVYNKEIVVDVPKGRHTVTLSNTGKDWMGIEKIKLTGYNDGSFAFARCLGLAIGGEMMFWVQNKGSNWKAAKDGQEPGTIKDAYFDVSDTEDGAYEVEWWDTYKGVPVGKHSARALNGVLRVDIPEFSRDIACKVRKEKEVER